ncbi:MAG: AsmA-like C-terminal region-containing protein, partial [bacterium]|nr:AsmA-like C-terminal region-containing protein [bacterium]
MSIVLAPAEMPVEIREKYFGNFFANPGDQSRLTLESAMKGDVLGAFRGDGKLAFSDLMIGRDGDHQLAFEGEAPLRVDSQRLLANPNVQLIVRDASLKLGDGQWKGKVLLGYTASRMVAGSSGSISGVRINQLLGAFTTAEDAVHGIAEIPRYNLSGSGKNAEELRNSLTGKGRIELKEGHLSLFDLVERTATTISGKFDDA